MRDEFEAWANSCCLNLTSKHDNGDYYNEGAYFAWLAWQAAAKIERERLEPDARRYRYMRNNAQFQNKNGPGLYWYLPRLGSGSWVERLDAAIDEDIRNREG